MKKVFIFCLAFLGIFFTGCTGEKDVDFTLISEDYQAADISPATYILIEDYSNFKKMFPDFESISEFESINQETFENHALMYFVYNAPMGVYGRSNIILSKATINDETLIFEVLVPQDKTTAVIIQTMYYLVEIDIQEMKNITNFKVIEKTYLSKPL